MSENGDTQTVPKNFDSPGPMKRLVLVGDTNVGKTTLVMAFQESSPSTGQPAVVAASPPVPPAEIDSDDSSQQNAASAAQVDALLLFATLKKDETQVELSLWDPPSDFTLNKAVYAHANAIILMYSIDSRESFKNVTKKWRVHLKKYLTNKSCPLFLVGNKLDLRVKAGEEEDSDEEDDDKQTVSKEEGEKLAKKLGAVQYFECSALNKEGIYEIFSRAGTHVVEPKSGKCLIS